MLIPHAPDAVPILKAEHVMATTFNVARDVCKFHCIKKQLMNWIQVLTQKIKSETDKSVLLRWRRFRAKMA